MDIAREKYDIKHMMLRSSAFNFLFQYEKLSFHIKGSFVLNAP